MITLEEAAVFLQEQDDFLLLCHQYPDGDTIGSATALCRALQKMGKRACIHCADEPGPKYAYLFMGVEPMEFVPKFIVAVDVADRRLLGARLCDTLGKCVDLCVDHHGSNREYARRTYVDARAASTTEIIYALIKLLGVEPDNYIADCIYTGITTDTGCFRYKNATARTYRVAADMMELGADAAEINRVMFDTKSRPRLEMERQVIDGLKFYHGDRCAVIFITQEMIDGAGAAEDDMEGLSALPRQVEGVLAGVTIREKHEGGWKVSVRTQPPLNAAKICQQFAGGGHPGAAGCVLFGTAEEAREEIVQAIGEALL